MEHGVEVIRATDNADTLIAREALNISLASDEEVQAEDTDILCLLVHHFSPEHHNEIVVTTRWGSFCIKHNVNQLDPKEKAILLRIRIHSFSGCDTVSRFFGFSKEKIFKKAVVFYRTTGP